MYYNFRSPCSRANIVRGIVHAVAGAPRKAGAQVRIQNGRTAWPTCDGQARSVGISCTVTFLAPACNNPNHSGGQMLTTGCGMAST